MERSEEQWDEIVLTVYLLNECEAWCIAQLPVPEVPGSQTENKVNVPHSLAAKVTTA
jgi:hypothetical protein